MSYIKINNEGRVTIPVELRAALGIKANDTLDITSDGEKLTLKTADIKCAICGGTPEENAIHFFNRPICQNCINLIKNKIKGE